MRRESRKMTPADAVTATSHALRAEARLLAALEDVIASPGKNDRYAHLARRDYTRTLNAIREDHRRDVRIERHACVACFYTPGLAGAAITIAPCRLCGEDITNSSTKTDAVCLSCAQAHQLCARCGGDINRDASRTDYAFAPREEPR